jgi:penicillin amidase
MTSPWPPLVVRNFRRVVLAAAAFCVVGSEPSHAATGEETARQVTIYRDQWGVPHIHGPTDESVVFGFAYCQAEDYFWQVEENLLRAIGRAAEANGPIGLDSDLLTHNFNLPESARERYPRLPDLDRMICSAFASGVNYYLATHPETKPRLLDRVEPWHVFAHRLQIGLDWMFTKARVGKKDQKEHSELNRVASNGWAIGPSRTKDGSTMLFINPHQPWFGPGSWYEGHIKSDEGWNFSGACFYANPFPSLGHNERLGWGHTANRPDVADAFRLTFDDSSNPLRYRSGDGYREATRREATIRVKTDSGVEERKYVFTDTHLGPIVKKEDETRFIAVRIAGLDRDAAFTQSVRMTKARTFDEWRDALDELQLTMFNCIYADRDGNIAYIYNGAIPRRDPSLGWDGVVDGSDPRAEWQGYHAIAELPQCVNPETGYVQNCNQSPFLTTDDENPVSQHFPDYMVEDKNVETRRAQRSRQILRAMHDATFEDWVAAATDVKLYWPTTIIPDCKREFARIERDDPKLAARLRPYCEHLFDWDYQGGLESTQATLCFAWYQELYQSGDLAADLKMKPKYMAGPRAQLEGLATAANTLKLLVGDWKIPWGKVARMQRLLHVRDQADLAFGADKPSLPCPGMPGQLGTIFNTTYLPPTPQRRALYGVAGHSYFSCIEFGKNALKARSLVPFGQSADPASPHFFDQAEMFSNGRMKEAWFDWDDVLANAKETYHPGRRASGG